MKNIFQDNRGLTLIEVLVAMGIFVFLVIGIIDLMLWAMRGRDIVWEQLSTQNEGRKIVQDFTNELRRATASSIGAYPLEIAESQQIVFYSNIDTDSWRERIRYYISDKTLKKGVTKPTGNPLTYNPASEVLTDVVQDVANGISSLFYYYDQSYTGASSTAMASPVNITNVRMVGISLSLEEKPNVAPAPFNIEAKVEIRNLKSN
ncbi:MAG: prepilin-type N-terminal cleavage/methylation domain-containing protein [bacterium]|nr:prepilin-type N-terminal cleavage/methylation domain-containing protein [bacterium]